MDEGDYDMFVVYVKSDRIGIRTAWPDGFEASSHTHNSELKSMIMTFKSILTFKSMIRCLSQ